MNDRGDDKRIKTLIKEFSDESHYLINEQLRRKSGNFYCYPIEMHNKINFVQYSIAPLEEIMKTTSTLRGLRDW